MADQKFIITVEVETPNEFVTVTDVRHQIETELRALKGRYQSDDWRRELRYSVVKGGRILE